MVGKRLMIVEDQRIVAEDLHATLERLGYEVCAVASSGEKALAAAEKKRPHLAIMDIVLKGEMDGTEAAEALRARFGVPVVFLSAFADNATIEMSKRSSPLGFLVKPFNEKELVATIENALYRHRMEVCLKESETWLYTTLSSIGDGVIATDAKGVLRFLNPEAERLTGWKQSEAMGRSVDEILILENEATDEVCESPVKKVVCTGRVTGGANHTLLVSRDGRRIPVQNSGAPIYSRDRELTGAVLVFRDDTAAREAQREIVRQRDLAQMYLDLSGTIFIALDCEGKVTMLNRTGCRVLGVTEEEGLGKNWFENFLPVEVVDEVWAVFKGVMASENELVSQYMNPIRTSTGEQRMIQWCNTPIRSEGGGIDGILCSGVDMTERFRAVEALRESEEQLRRAQKMEAIGTLAGGVAHDFNNVLSIILGNAELAEDDISEGHPVRAYVNEIKGASLRARDMVRRLLSFARKSEAGREIFSMQEVVKDSLALLRATLPASIEIHVDAEAEACFVAANEGQMLQVIVNLCTNAFHAMPEGGELKIRVGRTVLNGAVVPGRGEQDPGPYVALSVCDSGVGMDSETLERIFDPYFTTREVGQGSGMGLSVVHGIVHSHGGIIQVRSRPGEGTEVTVLLPGVVEAADAGEGMKEISTETTTRILLVDDEPALVRMTERVLERIGCQVLSFTDPLEAVGVFAEIPEWFDLVITDMTMPKMSGEQLASHVHGNRPDLPVILCTGYSDRVKVKDPGELGVSICLMKPLTRGTIIRAMGEVMRAKGG